MKNIIGIDFGTTKTLVAWKNSRTNRVELVRLGQNGTDKIPTSVFVNEDGSFLFGEDADEQIEFDATRYQRAFKLQLGTENPCMSVKVNNELKHFTAVELTSHFLKYIKDRCEKEVFFGNNVTDAIITIPVSFSPAQKKELEKAATNAGFSTVTLLPEPEAAGQAFARYNPTECFKSMMIVDWGGGTVDFAQVTQTKTGEIHANSDSFGGDSYSGGEIFDEYLWQYVSEKLAKEDSKGRDPQAEPLEFIYKMVKDVRASKERLSKKEQTPCSLFGSEGPYRLIITREEFNHLIQEKVESVAEKLQKLLEKIQQKNNTFPEALLMIGGSSHIPFIQKVLSQKSGLKCISWQYSHEAVALGAAMTDTTSVKQKELQQGTTASTVPLPQLKELFSKPDLLAKVKLQAGYGDVDAQVLAGDYYSQHGETQNLTAAFNYYMKAAKRGDDRAQTRLGDCYRVGCGVEKNEKEAKRWYRSAAMQGNSDAKKKLSQAPQATSALLQLKKLFSKPDLLAKVKQQAKDGNIEAQMLLAKYYFIDGPTQNYYEAVKWYKKAAEQGNAVAQNMLGNCYREGCGVEKNENEAKRWYHSAAMQGNSDAKKKLSQAPQASSTSNSTSTAPLPQLKELFSKPDLLAKVKLKAGYGNIEAQMLLAEYYFNDGPTRNLTEALKWYRNAAEQGNADAQKMLGNCYYSGMGVTLDHYEALKWFRKAAEQGNADAQNILGNCYYSGEGVTLNRYEAVKWYRKAAEQGNARGQRNLGCCYYSGDGVIQNYYEALKWFRKAADQGNANAQNMLGDCFYSGNGVKQNYKEAVKWFRKAAEQGEPWGIFNLGHCYQHGNGVPKIKTEAIDLFKKAATAGIFDARKRLFNLGHYYSDYEKNLLQKMKDLIPSSWDDLYKRSSVPTSKLYNAIKCYGYFQGEVLALYDSTFWGAADDGFCITTDGIWGHNLWEENIIAFLWDEIDIITFDSSSILINNKKITVTKDANHLASILRKLKNCYDEYFNKK